MWQFGFGGASGNETKVNSQCEVWLQDAGSVEEADLGCRDTDLPAPKNRITQKKTYALASQPRVLNAVQSLPSLA